MKTILVVNDDQNQLLLYKQELRSEGYNVITASDGISAVKKVRDYLPDLIVMEIVIPNMDALESLGTMLINDGKIPIIINTALSNYNKNFMTWPADAYLIKSSNLNGLKDKIKELLSDEEIKSFAK